MKKALTLAIATALFFNLTTRAQTIYELHEVKQVPSIDKNSMDIIASSIQKLFEDAIKDPIKNSSTTAANETVYAFYDSDEDGKLYKINDRNGKQYSIADSSDLRKNQFSTYGKKEPKTSLFFNLTFNENGKLIVPEKIYVISYRTEDVKDEKRDRTTIEQLGLLAFELTVSDSIKNQLSQVKLKTLAQKDINSLSGGLKPVAIKCPFNLQYGVSKTSERIGQAKKRGNQIEIYKEDTYTDWYGKKQVAIDRIEGNEKENIIKLLNEQTEFSAYKKGDFNFTIVENYYYRSIGFNIVSDNIIANRVSKTSSGGFSTQTEKVIAFSGVGKKIKK